MRHVVLALLALSLSIASPASAGSITVLNPGFEALGLPGPGTFALGNIPDWSTLGQTATFWPDTAEFPGGRRRVSTSPRSATMSAAAWSRRSSLLTCKRTRPTP